jgi:hypothetical protein
MATYSKSDSSSGSVMSQLSRRHLLQCTAITAALAVSGGVMLERRLQARERLKQKLLSDAAAKCTPQHEAELQRLPAVAREQVREYFHGVCLNVHRFVTEINSTAFGARLRACRSEQEQLNLCHLTFSQRVVTSVEVMNRIDVIATELGAELDLHWRKVCDELQTHWTDRTRPRARAQVRDLALQLEPFIVNKLSDAGQQGTTLLGEQPDLARVGLQIGKSAIQLLPIIRIRPELGLPLFLITALVPLWTYVIAMWNDNAQRAQFAITEKLSLLGNRVGAEFETEVRLRITQLQQWQQQSIENFADKHSAEVYPLWF